jgi:hypothetical protein
MLFVDATGKAHDDKTDILKQKIPPLVSFRKEPDGSFRVYTGLPPRNTTQCGSGEMPDVSKLDRYPEMQAPVVLNSGDWISLSSTLPLTIPETPIHTPVTPADKLSELIASASIGDTVVLGRAAVKECSSHVSRAHITIKILDREQDSPTRMRLRVLAIPGIEGTHPIYEVKPNGHLEEIIGNKTIRAGGTIQLGYDGERVTLPHPKNSLGEASVIYHQSIIRGDKSANESVMSVFGAEGLKHAQFTALQDYVLQAIALIREGRSAEALEHLRTESKELAASGYELMENNLFSLPKLTFGAVEENLNLVANRSSFNHLRKLIYPSIGVLSPGLKPTNEEERNLLKTWEKNVALIYAEEYVHALQEMHGGAISDYTPILWGKGGVCREADVALLYKRHGIDLSDRLFTNRYATRDAAIQRVEGTQTSAESANFKDSLLSAPLNSAVKIHNEVTIARTEGGYLVTPIGTLFNRYYMTAHGPAQEIHAPVTLQGGDQLFLGHRTFELPLLGEVR